MADYIYLLQNRLTPAQRRALEAVREAARARSMPVFLVGGAVRDLSSGAPVRDLDFALQGDVSPLLDELKGGGAVVAGENPALASAYLIFPGGVRVEVGPTQTVSYPKPGHPESQPAAILEDLRHRDFTADGMAISLNEGSYGLLLDPLNGIADMENRELRLSSNYGFIERPELLLRVARLSARLGWTLEERSQARYETAKEEKYIDALSAFERGYELEEVFHEDDPLAALEHLTAEGWADALYPAWTAAKADREGLDRVRDLIGQMEQMGIFVDPSPVFFPLLTARLAAKDVAAIKAMFPRQGFVEQIDSLEARSRDLAHQLTSRSAAASETWKLLFAAEPEVVLWLAYTSRSGAVQAKLKSFLNEWPQARTRLPYALMQEMRITADLPGYDQLLEDLFFAQIDGKLSTPEATRAFLEPHSPPAPVVQAPPRRRPAKAARGRGRKAVEEVAATVELPGTELAEVAEGLAPGGPENAEPETVSEQQAERPPVKTPAKKTAGAKSHGKKASEPAHAAAAAHPAAAASSGSRATPSAASKAAVKAPVAAKKASAKTEERAIPAKKSAAKAPVKSAPPKKTANPPTKSKSAAHGKVAPKKASTPAKSQRSSQSSKAVPAKKVAAKAGSAKSAKTPAKNSGRGAASAKVAVKGGSAHKAAAKKAAAGAHKKTAANKAAPAKKGRPAPTKGRR